MMSDDTPEDLAIQHWDHNGPLYEELDRRFWDQFAKPLLGEDAMPRLRTLYRTIGKHEPLSLMIEDLAFLPDPLFSPSDPEYRAEGLGLPPDLRAGAVEFFRTVIELATRYSGEFIARNADLAASAPEHRRDYFFLNRTVDKILVRLEGHLKATLGTDEAVVEVAVA